MAYGFDEQVEREREQGYVLDAYYSAQGALVEQATPAEDKYEDTDRWFTTDKGRFRIQYKHDFKAHSTHNLFVETTSSPKAGHTWQQVGWAYHCSADFILYHVVSAQHVLWLRPAAVTKCIDLWLKSCRIGAAENDTYWTYGALVPISKARGEGVVVRDDTIKEPDAQPDMFTHSTLPHPTVTP